MKKLLIFISLLTSYAYANSLEGITYKNLDNQPVMLEQYKGKPTYVKMWASWCPICLAGLEEVDNLTGKEKNFNVITIVSPDKKGEKNTEDFIEWFKGLDYKNIIVLLDEQGETLKQGKVRGYPSSLVLDKELNIVKTIPGHFNNDDIEKLFEEKTETSNKSIDKNQ